MTRIEKENKNQNDEPLEKKLWKTADKLRKNMDAAEYKHIVLGLIDLIGSVELGTKKAKSKDLLGKVFL